MPIISTFFGIVIRMSYQEHEPPHFHAEHQGQMAKCNMDDEIIAGYIRSATARALIQRWRKRTQSERKPKASQSGIIIGICLGKLDEAAWED